MLCHQYQHIQIMISLKSKYAWLKLNFDWFHQHVFFTYACILSIFQYFVHFSWLDATAPGAPIKTFLTVTLGTIHNASQIMLCNKWPCKYVLLLFCIATPDFTILTAQSSRLAYCNSFISPRGTNDFSFWIWPNTHPVPALSASS